jgi:hypothetical protein
MGGAFFDNCRWSLSVYELFQPSLNALAHLSTSPWVPSKTQTPALIWSREDIGGGRVAWAFETQTEAVGWTTVAGSSGEAGGGDLLEKGGCASHLGLVCALLSRVCSLCRSIRFQWRSSIGGVRGLFLTVTSCSQDLSSVHRLC